MKKFLSTFLTIFIICIMFSTLTTIVFAKENQANSFQLQDSTANLTNSSTSINLVDKEIKQEEESKIEISSHSHITASLGASISSNKINELDLTYSSARDIMYQYVTKNNASAKLLNNNSLYSYNIASGTISLEYTFPVSDYLSSPTSGMYYSSQDDPKAFIDEDTGILYYGYNSYKNTFSNDEIMNIVVYDLENSKVLNKFTVSGHILASIGADKKGNIYIGTDDYIASGDNRTTEYYMLVLSSSGKKITQKKMDNQINSFSGFCDDGTFYYIDEYMAYSTYGYANLMGRLTKGTFKNNSLSLLVDTASESEPKYMAYVKNIYFSDYNTPVEILNNEYLVIFNGAFYPLNKITNSTWSCKLYTAKDLEMGSEYSYIYSAGVNSIINGDNVYTLNNNNTIFVYSLSSGKKLKTYTCSKKIFNMKDCGNYILALETDGSKFYYEKISKSSFKTITTKTYNMNNFSVYKGRTKNDIINKFMKAAPSNSSATLYSSKSSEKAPYKAATLTSTTKKNALNISNYYRWLAGLSTFSSASNTTWNKASKGAVLLAASNFSHTPNKPSKMSDSFYKAAKEGTSNSNIAMNYASNQNKLIYTIRQFMNDIGDTIPGHRNTFLTRNATNIAYGISSNYVCQTVEYKGNPNPQGTANKNNEAAYAWPSAGYFPAEDLSTSAYWTVNLNTDKLDLSNIGLVVTIKDLDTGKTYKRTSSANGLYATTFWGKYISFAPPKVSGNSYSGKRYKVTLTNLADSNGLPAKLEYTVNFFSYNGKYKINGTKSACTEYGKLATPSISVSNSSSGVKISWKKVNNAQGYYVYKNDKKIKNIRNSSTLSYTDKSVKNGKKYKYKVVAYTSKVKSYESSTKTIYRISRPTISSVNSKKKKSIIAKWKKNSSATGYQIQYSTSSKFTSKTTKTVTISKKSTVSKTISKLKSKKKYYVRIRTYKKVNGKKYYSSYSTVKQVKTK